MLPVGAGALATLVSRLIGKGLSFGFIVILVRQVSQTDFAAYSYLVALALTFSLLSDSGVAVVAGRDVARGDLGLAAAYRGGLNTVMGAGVIGALAVGAFGVVAPGPGIPPMALVFTAAFVLVSNVSNFQCDLLRGAGRLGLEGALQIVGGVLFVAVGTTIVVLGWGLVALMAAFTLKELLMVGIIQLALPSPRSAPHTPGLGRSLLRIGIIMSAATTCLAILARLSLIVLSNVAPARETAHYAAAFRFGEIALMVCHTLGLGLLPYMSRRYAVDRKAGARLALRLTALAVGACLLVTPLLVLITPTVVTFVFGAEYAGAGVSAEILVGMLPILMLLILTWNALLADRRERSVLVAAIAGLAAAGASSTWIVAEGSGRSAALSALVSFAAVAVVCTWSLLRASAGGRRSAPPRLTSAPAETSDDVLV
jgi:O-antigen/teichoic acid export membrane protein